MNEKFVINIGRQLGSGGKAVGERLAERFGIPVYDKRLIKMAAEHSGFGQEFFEKADEKPAKGFFATLLGYLRSPFAGDDAIYNNPLSHDALFKMQSDVIRQLAERESCIFVGRCADYILREHPRCVNIFVSASREDRIERLVRTRRKRPNSSWIRPTKSAPTTTTITATARGAPPRPTTSASTRRCSASTARPPSPRSSSARN